MILDAGGQGDDEGGREADIDRAGVGWRYIVSVGQGSRIVQHTIYSNSYCNNISQP